MELSDEDVVEVMSASFPREREILMRVTSMRENEDGDRFVTLDQGERIVGVVSGRRLDMVWVSLGEDAEVEQLRRWKAEATEVIAGWERVYEACGSPGPLGGSKSENLLEALRGDGVI